MASLDVQVPVVLGIALDDGGRKRLASQLEGVGIVMFTPDLATAHALLGRQVGAVVPEQVEVPTVVRVGELEVDRSRRRAWWRNTPLALTQRERDLLALMAPDPGRVWTYRELHAAAWHGRYLDPGPVHAAVKRLRRKLREASVLLRIDAVRGVGYELVQPV